ncbi:hypothetical protein NQ315_007198, partial [Exocentrus adspersus]
MRVMVKEILLLCVYFSVAAGMSDEMKDLLNSLHTQCSTNTGASEATIAMAQKGDFEEDENLKCYMRCILEETGLIEDNGNLDTEGMVAMLPDEVKGPVEPIVRKCATTVTGSSCDAAFVLNKCLFAEAPKAVSDEMKDLLASLHAQCAAKTGVSEDTITKAQKGEFEEDDKLKCYMKCLLEEPGLFDENDKIDLDGLIAMLPDEIRDPFSPTIKKCGAI